MTFRTVASGALVCLLAATVALAADPELFEQPPFSYSATTPRDATARLQARLAAGAVSFSGSDRQVLGALLREFAVPAESQVLVFSKTSLQRQRIRPDNPRAIYFSDSAYVAWVPGGLIEVTTIDPVIGPVFYAVDPAALRAASSGAFERDRDCLRCHGGTFVPGIPGLFVRSVFSAPDGEMLLQHGSEVVDFRTPFENRWGGWYVTGRHGKAVHRGESADPARRFAAQNYLAPGSDIVALLVLEHQTAMQNTLTRASLHSRRMLDYQRNLQRDRGEPVTDDIVLDSVKSVFDGLVQDIVDDLLFRGEAPLPEGIEGDAAFQRAFRATAPRSAAGDSLKDLALGGHLFANRCSYLIYSESFLALPVQLQRLVHARLADVLLGGSADARYPYLDAAERARIAAILRETHPEMAAALSRERGP